MWTRTANRWLADQKAVSGSSQLGCNCRGRERLAATQICTRKRNLSTRQKTGSRKARRPIKRRHQHRLTHRKFLPTIFRNIGIAYDWHTLTDALGRALIANCSTASRAAGMPGSGATFRAGIEKPGMAGEAGQVPGRLPAFPGEREAAGLDRPAPVETRTTPPAEADGQMRLLEQSCAGDGISSGTHAGRSQTGSIIVR